MSGIFWKFLQFLSILFDHERNSGSCALLANIVRSGPKFAVEAITADTDTHFVQGIVERGFIPKSQYSSWLLAVLLDLGGRFIGRLRQRHYI